MGARNGPSLGLTLALAPARNGETPYRDTLLDDWRRLLHLALVARDGCVIDVAMRMLHRLSQTTEDTCWDERHRLYQLWAMAAGVLRYQGTA